MLDADPPTKYAEQICDWLEELGYTHCFFVAGGNIMHLLDGARTRFTCVPVVHEVAAGIAAEYFNESTNNGRAFALVTAGPGVSNIVTAMAGAWLESRELLVLAGQVKSEDLATDGIRQRGIQEIDGVGLTRAVSKASVSLSKPIDRDDFMSLVQRSSTDRPGPVFIEFCLDVQGGAPVGAGTHGERAAGSSVPTREASESQWSDLYEKLRKSSRPILLIGGGVSRQTAAQLHGAFAQAGIPLMTTWNGADRIAADHPLYLGRPNTWGQRAANLLVAQSDLLIAVGTRLGLQQTGFNWQEYATNAFVVHVDIDQSELDKGHPRTDMRLCVDANSFLRKLISHKVGEWDEWLQYGQHVSTLLPLNDPENVTGVGFISPYVFFEELSQIATGDDIVIPCSSGGANSVAMQTLRTKNGQIVVTNKGLASMGYGLSGAIGSALACPGRRVFLIEGDGGFTQNLQELATVHVNRLPIKIFIFANNGYGSIRMTQKNYFNGAYLGCDTETGLGFPEWSTLFKSYSIACMDLDVNWSTDPRSLAALASDEPYGFIVPIDPLQTYWPKITSRITHSGSMESNPLHKMSPDLSPEIHREVTRYLQPWS